MKESEAKKKQCFMKQNFMGAPMSERTCYGSECVAWEPEYEKKTIELEQNEKPSGEGWGRGDRAPGQPKVTWYRWVPTDSGDCGLKSKEQGCFYP